MSEPVVLVAASGLAAEVIETIGRSTTQHVTAVVDDDPRLWGSQVSGVEVVGAVESVAGMAGQLLVCAGHGRVRAQLVDRLTAAGVDSRRYATLVEDSVRVPPSCAVGAGSIVLAGVVLTASVTVGRHVVVMPHVTLTHDDVVEDFATLCAGVSLGGRVCVAESAYLGMNASVRENTSIGAGATLGMGSVALDGVPAGEVWVGNPARRLRAGGPP